MKRKAKETARRRRNGPNPPLVWETGVTLLLEGDGASDAGDKPFVDLLNLDTGATRRLWECTGQGALERPGSIISDAKASPITLDTLKNSFVARDAERESPVLLPRARRQRRAAPAEDQRFSPPSPCARRPTEGDPQIHPRRRRRPERNPVSSAGLRCRT